MFTPSTNPSLDDGLVFPDDVLPDAINGVLVAADADGDGVTDVVAGTVSGHLIVIDGLSLDACVFDGL